MIVSYFLDELFGFNFHLSDHIHTMPRLFPRGGSGSPEVSITPLAGHAFSK
jgi:hypothetical protein